MSSKFIIKGGVPLKGTVRVSGSKNAALPIMCACLLTPNIVTLKNVPEISDIESMRAIFTLLNVKTEWVSKNTLEIDSRNMEYAPIPHEYVSKMRASILLLGPMISRLKKVKLAFPGGCVLGKRSTFAHTEGLSQLKVQFKETADAILATGKPKSGKVILSEMSVTATENVIMASVISAGTTEIFLSACEPHVQDLCHFLNSLGAKISGIGSHTLKINGVNSLSGGTYTVTSDYLEAGTLVLASALTQGEVTLENFPEHDLDFFLYLFKNAGGKYSFKRKRGWSNNNDMRSLTIHPSKKFTAVDIKTAVHPGFPTDLQAPFSVLLTQAKGESQVYETLFEGRLNYLYELEKMGARVVMKNANQATIYGKTDLKGMPISSCDIRAGAAMVLAGLIAKGTTEISNILYIDRGYENFESKLKALGADIRRTT